MELHQGREQEWKIMKHMTDLLGPIQSCVGGWWERGVSKKNKNSEWIHQRNSLLSLSLTMSLLSNCLFQLSHTRMCSFIMCTNRATLPHIRLCQIHANAICDQAGKIKPAPKPTKRGEIFMFFFSVGFGELWKCKYINEYDNIFLLLQTETIFIFLGNTNTLSY